jgi:fermentation-respiration switch protein FrsA (DUF1100 family)
MNSILLIFVIALLLVLLYSFLRWFERLQVWVPERKMFADPSQVGLAYEDVYFRSEDGVRLNGWYVPCEGSSASLLFCHGNGGNICHRLESLRQFHRLGLSVFAFDYRGYGNSEGTLSEAGTYLDAEAAYRWLREREAPERIILFGRSLGGSIATQLATRVEAAALICESGFTSIANVGRELFPLLPVRLINTIKYDTLAKIRDVRMPVMFIHSTEDELIPFSHSERLYAAAREPKMLVRIHGKHNGGHIECDEEYCRAFADFLQTLPLIPAGKTN